MIKQAAQKIFDTARRVYEKLEKDEVFSFSEQLTYRLLASLFPLLLFFAAALSFLEVDKNMLITSMERNMPGQVFGFLRVFVEGIANTRNAGALTLGLVFTAFGASSGFSAFIQGVNKTYGDVNCRGFVKTLLLSFLLLLVFTVSIAAMFSAVVFLDEIFMFAFRQAPAAIHQVLADAAAFALLVLTLSLMYKLAHCKRTRLISVAPGAAAVVLFWALLTSGLNIYYEYFMANPGVYGSLAGLILLIIWLNAVSLSLLMGSELNIFVARFIEGRGRAGAR